MKIRFILLLIVYSAIFNTLIAQNKNEGQIHGNFQADMQYYNLDTLIGAPDVPEKLLMNSYANFNYTKGAFSAGFRYEGYLNTLQGFDSRYDGVGIPYRYATYKADELEITVGSYYEQFGNGLIFRAYEDKNLGYDNAMDGVRLKYNPLKGIYLKGIIGKQRYFFEKGAGIIRGIDGEFSVNDIISKLTEKKTQIIIGGAFVSKYQVDLDPLYKLPENVGAFAGRLNVIHGKFNLSGEYAYKINDPSSDNGFIYKPGESLLLNATYSQKGLGILLSAKRVDNMSFRSDRNENLNNLNINFLPAITKSHIYNLAAMYPFATQPNGEVGFQAEVIYKIKKKTKLGGKYGTNITVNFARVNSLATTPKYDGVGYESDFFSVGDEIYFQDFNIELSKKFNKKFKAVLSYLNLIYNKDVIQGMAGYGTIYADIAIADITYKFKPKKALRLELQSLTTEQDYGNWAMGLIEYSIAPHWFFSVYDQYNYGNQDTYKRIHYFTVSTGFTKKANRFQISYGKQREGIICVGGVCRNVPASNGLSFSITSSF